MENHKEQLINFIREILGTISIEEITKNLRMSIEAKRTLQLIQEQI